MSRKKKKSLWILFAALTAAFLCICILLVRNVYRVPLLAEDGSHFETGRVTEILEDNLQKDGTRVGNQTVRVFVTSGEYKGQTIEATSMDGYVYGAACRVGTHVVLNMSSYENTVSADVYNYNRIPVLLVFIGLFVLTLAILGGRKGIVAAAALAFDAISILCFYLPLMYSGWDPLICSILVSLCMTFFTLILLSGFSKKTASAVAGTLLGCILAGAIAFLFGKLLHINGYNNEDAETLILIEQSSRLNSTNLMFSGILIGALGAVMDVAMSISSSLEELHLHSPNLTAKELFRSGINIGRDMMGTMVNTLILAFVGSSATLLMIYYAYHMPMRQLWNSNYVAQEILEGLSGTFGVVLTVPIVSAIAARLYTGNRFHFGNEKN